MLFYINIFVPVLAGVTYFIMARSVVKYGKMRVLIFGELGYRKVYRGFLLFAIYLITRPLQNILGPHPYPMIVNSARQFFLMAVIAPAILVGIFHWAADEGEIPRTVEVAAYAVGFLMALVFILINTVAIDGAKLIVERHGWKLYDAVWFSSGSPRKELVLIHLIIQAISPVGYFLLAAGYVRHRRHNYPEDSVYNLLPLKWKYHEIGLIILALSFIVAGFSALIWHYFTYLWVIYFSGAIVCGIFELKGIKLPPRAAPLDLL